MITKITNGSRPGDLAAYLHGPGRKHEHVYDRQVGGAVIGGTLGREGDRDGMWWAQDLRAAAGMRPDIAKPIWHMSVRAAPTDRTLSDSEWADVAHDMGTRMGWADRPYVVVRHGADHVHIVVSRVGDDGSVWNRRNDRYTARRAANAVEERLGLTRTPERTSETTARRADHQVTQGEYRAATRTAATPPRVQLAERVRAARDAATGRGREGFEAALTAAGVEYRVNIATTGRVSGYSFALPDHTDSTGEQVWWKASQLDKQLSWRHLSDVLDAPRPVPAVEVPKKLLETRTRHAERVQAAQHAADAAAGARALAQVPARAAAAARQNAAWWARRNVEDQGKALSAIDAALERARSYLEAVEARAVAYTGLSDPRLATWAARTTPARDANAAARARARYPGDRGRGGPSLGR